MKKYDFMQGYTYILLCCDGSYYTGSTQDLRRRIWQHQAGDGAKYTARRLLVKLVYYEIYSRIDIAFKREKQLQGWSRKKKEALISGEKEKLHLFAVCKNSTHFTIRLTSSTLSTSRSAAGDDISAAGDDSVP